MSWIEGNSNGVTLRLLIQPKASKSEVVGIHGDPPRLKIRIAAPPVDGEANTELLRFLKKKLAIPSSKIHLVRGESSRQKDVFCEGIEEDKAKSLLAT